LQIAAMWWPDSRSSRNTKGIAVRGFRISVFLLLITKNSDGSTDLYFGPEAPAGKPAKNWVKTLPGKAWFTYFRFYGPTQSIAGVLTGSSPKFTLVGSASRIERLTTDAGRLRKIQARAGT
jgi:hypothetical protein